MTDRHRATATGQIVLSVNQTCQALGISRPTLYRMFAAGLLTTVRPSPGRRGVTREEIDRYLATTEAKTA